MSKTSMAWMSAASVAVAGAVIGLVVSNSGGYSNPHNNAGSGGYGSGVSAPTAPRSVSAAAGSKSATVRWQAPTSDGGAVVSDYVVTAEPGGATCASSLRSCTVTGLANGTTYSFTVVAHNAAGSSAASASSGRVTPMGSSGAHPVLFVRPSYGLSDGTTVTVTGVGFAPGDHVFLVECLTHATGRGGCDVATATPATVSASGQLSATYFRVVTGAVGTGVCGTATSNLSACAISAGNASGGDSAVAPIAFR